MTLQKFKQQKLFVVITFLVLAAMLVSCIGSPIPDTVSTSGGGSGTLNLTDSGPITLDPATVAEAGSAMYIMQIFSGLVALDKSLQIVPDIAQNWETSTDGQTYTFHLRHDAEFQNGKPVTAADFIYSWERALNPATGSLTAGTYLNDIVGAADVLSGKTTRLSGVRAADDYTLVVNIDAPKAYFIYKMAYPTSFVTDERNINSGGIWWQHPNGTGPFKLQQWQTDQVLVLERNETYYGEKTKLQQVNFQLYSGNSIQLYQEGSIDVSNVYSAYMGMVTDPSNSISKELHEYSDLSFFYIGFNTTQPPFDDANIRQAFSYAIDKERVLSLTTDNTVTPAYGILPPDMPGYNSDLAGLQYDPEKAKQLIAASGYGDVSKLPRITLTTSGWGNNISGLLGGIIEEWRRNLGVEVTVRQLEPDYISYVLSREKNELFDSGWLADYPDPQDFLDILFRTGSQNNTGEYGNLQVDALLNQAAIEQDNDTRMNLYHQAEKEIVRDAAVIPLFFGRNYILVKPYVKNYELSPLGYPLLKLVSIEK